MRALFIAASLMAAPAAAQNLPQQNAQSIWRPASASVEHLQSGLVCPETLAGLPRAGNTNFDAFGLDVGCGWGTGPVVITAYLTQGAQAEPFFESAKQVVTSNPALADAKLQSEGDRSLGGLVWRYAEYATPTHRSEIWVTDLGGWGLKYRVSYVSGAADQIAPALETLTSQIRQTAGRKLAACATSQPPRRTGKAQKRGDRDIADGLMSAILAGVPNNGPPQTDATQTLYCPEERLVVKNIPALFWRGVTPNGADAGEDRLSGMSLGPPPVLTVSRDQSGALVRAEIAGKAPREQWVASLERAGETSIYGYFDGRPSSKTLSAFFQRILAGEAKPLSSYKADGSKVTITVPSQ